MKLKLIFLFIFLLSFFNTLQAAEVRLATGSVIEEEKIEALLKCKTFNDIKSLISQDQTVKLYFINIKAGNRTRVSVSEDETTKDSAVINYYQQAWQNNLGGLYVESDAPGWNKKHSAIFVPLDVDFETLVHEYLHHAVAQNSRNGFYSRIHERKIRIPELENRAHRLEPEMKSLQAKMKEGIQDLSKDEQIRWFEVNIEYYINTILRTIISSLEEMEVDQFLFDHRKELGIEPVSIYYLISSLLNHSADIWKLTYDEDITALIGEMVRQLRNLYAAKQNGQDKNEELTKKFELLKLVLDDLLLVSNPLVENMLAFGEENSEQFLLYSPDNYRIGDIVFDGVIDEKDRSFLSSLLEDDSINISFPIELRCDLDGDNHITNYDLNWLNNILSVQDLRFGGVKTQLLEKAKERGYEIDLGEWSGSETDESVLPGLYSPYISLELVLADERSQGKNIKKIIFDAPDYQYDEKTKTVYLKREWGDRVIELSNYFYNLP